MAVNELLLLSGGMDSIALAWSLRPKLSLTVDYGQLPAKGEIQAASAVCAELGLAHRVLTLDCNSLGSAIWPAHLLLLWPLFQNGGRFVTSFSSRSLRPWH